VSFYAGPIPMKKSSLIVLGCAAAVLVLAACETSGKNSSRLNRGTNRFGYGAAGAGTQYAMPTPTPEGYTHQPVVDPFAPPTPTPTPVAPPPVPAPAAPRDISYGTPVPGKAGFVTSPHSPYAGYVDVRGFPPGTEVKCPYSGKIFLVP
jgi:hypothetical protein